MKKPFYFLLIMFACFSLTAQNFRWATSAGGPATEVSRHSTTDSVGNSYVLGYFTDSIDFDPGPGKLMLYSRGAEDIYIARYNSAGIVDWAKQAGGAGSDIARRIHMDEYGMLYFCGSFTDSLWFDSTSVHSLAAGTSTNGLVVKFTPSGQVIWSRQFVGDRVVINDVSSILKECVLTGEFWTTVDLDPGPGNASHASKGWRDALVCKLDSTGNLIWSRTYGGNGNSIAAGDCIGVNAGQVLVAGSFNEQIDLNPGSGQGIHYASGSTGQQDVFLLHLWHHDADFNGSGAFGGPNPEEVMDMTPVAYPNFVLCGTFSGPCDFDPQSGQKIITAEGGVDAFIMKVTHLESLAWVRTLGGIANENARAITMDHLGYLYITGYMQETVDMDLSEYEQFATSNGNVDMYMLVATDYGHTECFLTAGGPGSDGGVGIGVDDQRNVYVHGFYGGYDTSAVDFQPGPGSTMLHSPDLPYDIFTASYTTCSDFTSVSERMGANRVSLIPNPAAEYVELRGAQLPATVTLYDNTGKVVRTISMQNDRHVNLKGLETGIYFVKCESTGAIQTSKLLVR